MSTLYIRHYSRANLANAVSGSIPVCSFALASAAGAIEREGVAGLSQMAGMLEFAQRVVVILAASDVTLLQVKVPPLSAAKLKAAWPNLVEEQLIVDPAECVIAPIDRAAQVKKTGSGVRSVAVVQQSWLMSLVNQLREFGARNIAVLPAQLCLPYQAGCVSSVLVEQGMGIDLTLRWSDYEGMGIPILPEQGTDEQAQQIMQTLRTLMPARPMNLYVAQAQVLAYQKVADAQTTVATDNWSRWIAGAKAVLLHANLASEFNLSSRFERQRWRWPFILLTLLAIMNLAALHFDWWQMRREASSLRATMLQTFKASYPSEKVIIDPFAQMQQKILMTRQDAGQADANDFMMLVAHFGQAWRSVVQGRTESVGIAALEYRDGSLIVKLKNKNTLPGSTIAALKVALAEHKLSLSQLNSGDWQIRSGL